MLHEDSDRACLTLVSWGPRIVLVVYGFHVFAELVDEWCWACHKHREISILFNNNHIIVLSALVLYDACFTQMPLM